MKARPPGGSATVEPVGERDKGVGRILRIQSTSITASMSISSSGDAPALSNFAMLPVRTYAGG